MNEPATVRIDKYLWAVRLFKTRSAAAEACRKGKILVNGLAVKPSKNISAGDTLNIKKMPVVFSYLIVNITQKRLPAKMVAQYCIDNTTEEEKSKLLSSKITGIFSIRDKGSGRPTKKERRDLDNMIEDLLNNSH